EAEPTPVLPIYTGSRTRPGSAVDRAQREEAETRTQVDQVIPHQQRQRMVVDRTKRRRTVGQPVQRFPVKRQPRRERAVNRRAHDSGEYLLKLVPPSQRPARRVEFVSQQYRQLIT
ncbi:hypothetical protein, partial [Mycobacterium sp. ENV421]|uniref:hypothetical protein n=1 Tax=Mycobacterium sp. ENV421 TaxID=1213407 RepID=UPI001E41DC23